jgi:hypothetical protein
MKYLGFYFLTGGVITVSLLLAAFWIHWREIRRISWANTLGLIVMVSIFWPLLILRLTTIPQLLWQLVGLDDSSAAWQATQKARQQALMNPPYCSSLVRFDASSYSDARGAQGVFHFPAEEVERQIQALITQNPHLQHDDEGGLLAWLQNRQHDDQRPVSVPRFWPRVIHTLDQLLRAGIGSAHCPSCGKDYQAQQLTCMDEKGLKGWNHNQLLCPAGHLLLRRKGIHILKKRNG